MIAQAKSRQVRRDWVRDYLQGMSCIDCGESDPVVLQFDHVRGTKLGNVSRMVSKGSPLSVIQAEVEKCDVVCANCHHRRTAKQQGWHWCQ